MPRKRPLYTFAVALTAYELARDGLSDYQISCAMGITKNQFNKWLDEELSFELAIERGRTIYDDRGRGYFYNKLTEEMKEVWDEISAFWNSPNGFKRVDAVIRTTKKPEKTRQAMYVMALVSSDFNITNACRSVGVDRPRLNRWKMDPEFRQLLEEVKEAYGDFYESALFNLVKQGHPNVTMFANRTINRHRGFDDKVRVEHSGQINHAHAVISVDDLKLPIETRKQILQAVRKADASNQSNGVPMLQRNGSHR